MLHGLLALVVSYPSPDKSGLDAFSRRTSVCSTCTAPTGSQGLRVLDAECSATASSAERMTLADCASTCAGDAECVSFGYLESSGTCETYRFTERYNVTVDPQPWQYWLRKDTPNVAPLSQPARVAVPPLLSTPKGNVTVAADGLFAKSMAISLDYLLRNYHVDEMLWWFRHRAGQPQPNSTAGPHGWDRCVNNIRGGAGHLCLKGSVASTFLMGAGGLLRWPLPAARASWVGELRRRFASVLAGIESATTPTGFIAAFAENETMYRENPDYVLAWLTHGLLEADVAASDDSGTAIRLARGMLDWFSSLGTNGLLPEFMPPDRTHPEDVPPVYGANIGHQIYLISQGIIHHSRMATTRLGRQRDVDVIATLYQEDEWLRALAAKDERAVWMKQWFPHNYEVTAFEAYFDMWTLTGNHTYKAAIDGAWEMFRESFLHVGGSMALNEGSGGTNLSAGLWYPPKSYYLEGAPKAQFQNATTEGHKTGETCGSVFWVKLNQRYHNHFPHDERYVAEIERSLLNIGIANQAPAVGSELAGIRSFALLHGHKNFRQNISTCCEGQGTRLHMSLPEYIFSLITTAATAAGGGPTVAAGASTSGGAGVSVDIYASASIEFDVAPTGGGGSGTAGRVKLTLDSPFPYTPNGKSSATMSLSVTPPSLRFKLSLRVPAWTAAKSVPISLNGDATFAAGTPGTYASFERVWKDGDVVRIELPMALRPTKYVGKNQVAGSTRWAYEYGPTLLAARPASPAAWDKHTDCLHIQGANASDPASWLELAPSTPDAPMRFLPSRAASSSATGAPPLDFVPYFSVADEQMTVYPCYDN
jgi:hypothetical protein